MKTYQTPEVLLRTVEPVDIVTNSLITTFEDEGDDSKTVRTWAQIFG